jgi:hypothetical protein
MTGACQPSCASRATSASTATTPPSSAIRLARASTCGTPTPRCSRGGLRSAPPVAVNGFFCTLARAARDRADRALVAWWSERRCAARWGRLVRPDGYGRWRDADAEIDFFVEVDRATEPAWRLADKLDGYATLAAVTGVATRCCSGSRPPSARRPPVPRSPPPAPPRPCRSPPPAAGPATSTIPPVLSGSRLAAPEPAGRWQSSPGIPATRRPRRRHPPPRNPNRIPMIPARRRPRRPEPPARL